MKKIIGLLLVLSLFATGASARVSSPKYRSPIGIISMPGTGAVPSATVATSVSAVIVATYNDIVGGYLINENAVDVYLAVGRKAVANAGILLKGSGGVFEINATNFTRQAIYGVTASGTSNICYQVIEY